MKKFLVALIVMLFVLSVYAQDEEKPAEDTQPAEETPIAEDTQPAEETQYPDDIKSTEDTPPSDDALSAKDKEAEDLLQPAENIQYDEEEQQPVEEEKPVKKKKTKKKKSKAAANQNVPGEVNKWMLNLGTNFIGVDHIVDVATVTSIGLPFTATSLAAGYQMSSQIWLMAKFHLFMTLVNDSASACFLLGPGIRADFIRTDNLTFFGEFFLSFGNEAKVFLLSPEIVFGIDYNIKNYLTIGLFTSFAYKLTVYHVNSIINTDGDVLKKAGTETDHYINFILGPRLSVFF